MESIDRLEAIEQIRSLKARYWRAVDLKIPALLRSVFTDRVVVDFQGATGGPAIDPALLWHDPDVFVADTMAVIANIVTVHHGFEPEIEILSDTDASAIWPMEDLVWVDAAGGGPIASSFHGYGHYHDRFRKVGGEWKIEQTRIARTRIDA